MAGLGAMLIGMIGGGIAWVFIIVITFMMAIVVFADAHRNNMNAVLWSIMALLFNFYSLPFYIYARVRSSTVKCSLCGAKVGNKNNFCPSCGTEVKKYDDGAFGKKVLKIVLIVIAVFVGISVAWTALTGVLNG